jgi:hypothetical protein
MCSSTAVETESVAECVRRRVVRSGERMWSVEDFVGSPSAVNSELRRLVARGELVRVRRGMYWRGRKSRFGMTGASQWDTLRKLLGSQEAIGASGWGAAKLLGLSTQVVGVEVFAATHRNPKGLSHAKVVSRVARYGRREARLNVIEVTFLEVLEGWERYVETDTTTTLQRFSEVLHGENVRVESLTRAARTEPAAVRERLRAVLAEAGYHDHAEHVPRARDLRTRERALRVMAATV